VGEAREDACSGPEGWRLGVRGRRHCKFHSDACCGEANVPIASAGRYGACFFYCDPEGDV
jgi:hypothetical protein